MKFSIRYQILVVITAILFAAVCTHLYLATQLVLSDKQAYVYDVNALLARTLSEEVESNLSSLRERVLFFARAPKLDEKALFDGDAELLSVELWERSAAGALKSLGSHTDDARLSAVNVSAEDLQLSKTRYPLNFPLVISDRTVLENVSVPPDVALLRLSALSDDGTRLAVAIFRPDRLLHIFSRTQPHEVYLVDHRGVVVVHPNAKEVISHADFSRQPLVSDALESQLAQRVREFDGPNGKVLGGWARVPMGRLSVAISVPRDEVFRAARLMIWKSVLFAACVLSLAFLAGIIVSSRLTRPLSELQKRMAELSSGSFGIEVSVKGSNELAALATAFNRMSRELSTREAQLSDANAQLVQSEKLSALGEMSAGIVHEVKNPMVAVVGFAELGKQARTLEQAQECCDMVLQGASRANDILQSVLSFARPGGVTFEPVDPAALLQGAARLVKHHLQLKGVQLQVDSPEGLPKIRANGDQLRQVLLNLMMNAGHAMEECPKRELMLKLRRDGDGQFVCVEVQDTGAGMSEEVQKSLFKPFFSTKERGKGTGLGLAVSRSIIDAHRGQISVVSAPGKGTTFTLRLPVDSEAAKAA